MVISTKELVAVAGKSKVRKAPSPDEIPNVELKAAIHAYPDIIKRVLQKYVEEGQFPDS